MDMLRALLSWPRLESRTARLVAGAIALAVGGTIILLAILPAYWD